MKTGEKGSLPPYSTLPSLYEQGQPAVSAQAPSHTKMNIHSNMCGIGPLNRTFIYVALQCCAGYCHKDLRVVGLVTAV